MSTQDLVFLFPAFISTILSLALTVYAWQQKGLPLAKTFAVLMLDLTFWSITTGLLQVSGTAGSALFWYKLRYIGITTVPVILFIFVLQFSGRAEVLTPWRTLLLFIIPLVTQVVIWSKFEFMYSNVSFRNDGPLMRVSSDINGSWYFVHLLYTYSAMLAGVILLFVTAIRSDRIFRGQAGILLIGASPPIIVSGFFATFLDENFLYLTPLSFCFMGLIYAWALFRYRVFNLTPLARDRVVEGLDEAMLILEIDGRLADANLAAKRMFGWVRFPIAQPAAELLAEWPEVAGLLEGRSQTRLVTHAGRQIEVRLALLQDHSGDLIGRVLLLHDQTEHSVNEQNLRAVLDYSPAAVILFDLEGHIQLWNNAAEKIYGWTEAEVLGRTLPTVPAEREQERLDFQQRVLQGETIDYTELQRKRNDGSDIYVSMAVAPLRDTSGRVYAQISLSADITARKLAENSLREQLRQNEILRQQLQEQAIRDPLTGLYNRRYLHEFLSHEFPEAQRSSYPISMVIIDVDHFKLVNDTYGHYSGDLVLQNLAGLLIQNTRQNDFVCRYGGEEFLLVLPNSTRESACQRAEEWRESFQASRVKIPGAEIQATISLGVAAFPRDGDSAHAIITAADRAMYAAKTHGRNRVELYNSRDG